jgi:hypothetical protein
MDHDVVALGAADLVEVVVRVELGVAEVVIKAAVGVLVLERVERDVNASAPDPQSASRRSPSSSTASARGVTIEKNPSPDWKLLFTLTRRRSR